MLHPIGILSFVVLGALSTTTARPFDRRRDGFLLGEGAAYVRLERESDARARGAPILARILGAGTSMDAHNVTAPHPDGHGAALAMRRALVDADISARDVDYVNAHGTGTPVGDRAEALAIGRVLGDVPVSSFKASIGHTIAAAGAVELGLCIGLFSARRIPATVGLEEPATDCPANVMVAPAARAPKVLISNSFGFGGQNCALVVGAP
jgi:3-oxoacyl-[acyl-carrier-protein] synthase II